MFTYIPKNFKMPAPLCFSVLFPFDSEVFRSCNLSGNLVMARGMKDGLISSRGKYVFGCASPLATRFATAGAMSLCTGIRQVGDSDIISKNSLSNKCLVGWAQDLTGQNWGKVYQFLFQWVIHPLVQENLLCYHECLEISLRYGLLPL